MKRLVAATLAVLVLATLLAADQSSVSGLDNEPSELPDLGENCNDSDEVTVHLSKPPPVTQDLYFVGTPLKLMAIAQAQNGWGNIFGSEACKVAFVDMPDFTWTLVSRPSGSSAALAATGLNATLTLDVEGPYTVRFTACPGGCEIDFPGDAQPFVVAETTREATFAAATEIAFPPQTQPRVRSHVPYCDFALGGFDTDDADDMDHPADPVGRFDPCQSTDFSDARRKVACTPDGGGIVDPQWVTTTDWDGPEDYVLVEGTVARARTSRVDNPLNHDSQDINVHVNVDIPYKYLVSTRPETEFQVSNLGVEWERDDWPERSRPSPGDRVSMFGYWIHDCGHEPFYTEVHPPVGAAVHRARAVLLPESLGLGTNVFSSGVVSDIWFNENSGEITNNCSDTGLHQPAFSGLVIGECVPIPHLGGASPLQRTYTFNVFLPPSPEQILADNGHPSPPDVALYVSLENDPSWGGANGPDPIIEQVTEGGLTYLRVTVDLTGQSSVEQYSRRIIAAWAYPSPDNWGLREYSVEINELEILSDADWTNETLGVGAEWRFWANIQNTDQEWTQIEGLKPWPLSCDCIYDGDHHDFGDRAWVTRAADPDRDLGPHVLVFPEQDIWLHTSGFEDDYAYSDDTGAVSLEIPQPTTRRLVHARSQCNFSSGALFDDSGCGSYFLNATIDPIGPVLPVLSAAGQTLYEQSIVTADELASCLASGGDDCLDLLPPAGRHFWHPTGNSAPDPRSIFGTFAFRQQPDESNALPGISPEDFADLVRTESPAKVSGALAEIRQDLGGARADRPVWDLLLLEAVLTPDQWQEHFADLPFERPIHGDADCDESLGSGDLFVILQSAAGLRRGIPCRLLADPDCNDAVGVLDLLILIRYQAGLPRTAPAGGNCPDIGSEFTMDPITGSSPTATATPFMTATVTPTITPTITPTVTPTITPTATATATPTATGGPSVTATGPASPTPIATASPTASPSATPSPSPTPDSIPPSITNVTHSPASGINDQPGCGNPPPVPATTVVASANINDNSGVIAERRVYWKYSYQGSGSWQYGIPLFSHLGTYRLTIDPASIPSGMSSAQLQYYFWAKDPSGNTTTDSIHQVTINNCTPID